MKGVIRVGNDGRNIMGKKEKKLSEFRTVNYQHEDNDVIKVGSRKKFVKKIFLLVPFTEA